jgi:hypothetical protein
VTTAARCPYCADSGWRCEAHPELFDERHAAQICQADGTWARGAFTEAGHE